MAVLLIDFESTGVDTKTARITEIGAMVVDENFQPLGPQVSTLVWESGYPAITPEVERVTHITQVMLTEHGRTPREAFAMLGELMKHDITHIIAYNRGYDEDLLKEELFRNELTLNPLLNLFLTTPWLCAMVDIEQNYQYKSWKLMHIALEYMVPVDPNKLHRAIADVELMRQVLVASKETPANIHKFQLSPWVYVRALVKKPWEDDGKSSGEAKTLGYSWEQCRGDETKRRFEKCWVKRIKEKNFEQEERQASFPVRLIGG